MQENTLQLLSLLSCSPAISPGVLPAFIIEVHSMKVLHQTCTSSGSSSSSRKGSTAASSCACYIFCLQQLGAVPCGEVAAVQLGLIVLPESGQAIQQLLLVLQVMTAAGTAAAAAVMMAAQKSQQRKCDFSIQAIAAEPHYILQR